MGVAGLLGALLTGVGEGLMQLAPGADYGDPHYSYFALIETSRQSLGYWLSVTIAPLYLLGYWHLTRNLAPTRQRLGFALFLVTGYAFVLAIGLVVDDAIVMLENIVRHIEGGMRPFEAALKGAREIGFAVIALSAWQAFAARDATPAPVALARTQ